MNSSAIWLQIPGEDVPFNLRLRRELPPSQMLGKSSWMEEERGRAWGALGGGSCAFREEGMQGTPPHPTSRCLEGIAGDSQCPIEDILGSAGWG